jgi:hypothetical protein
MFFAEFTMRPSISEVITTKMPAHKRITSRVSAAECQSGNFE